MSFNNSDPQVSISVENLSKVYRLRANQGSLRDTLVDVVNRALKKGRNDNDAQILWALKDVNFEVRRGEALGIAGPNGAGKTTILKILSKVTRATQGMVQVNGRLGALLELGAGFHPELTGRENIYLYGSILGLTRQEINRKFDQIVDFSGLERFVDTPVKRYSSGMYVRLAFSVSAHTEPDVLLVDEVLAVGDAQFRQKCVQRIKSLQREGVSIVFISHNLFQMQAVCERGIFLESGQVRLDGSIEEAIGSYEKWMRESLLMRTTNEERFDFIVGQGGEDLRILGLEVCDFDGTPKNNYDYDEGVEIRIHYIARRIFPSINFVLRIKRMDGTLCSMVRSSELGYQVGDIENQGYISIRLAELQLTNGAYLFEVRLRDSNDAVTLAKVSSAAFQVTGPGVSLENENGVFVPHILEVSTAPHLQNLFEVEISQQE
jgi:lipopolysaccharide transport system ATP-binding protein